MFSDFYRLPKLIFRHKQLIHSLAKREVVTQYIGSVLGVVWAFLHPLVLILVFWFIFSVGFRVKPMNDVPFVVWLTAGMAPWFYFADIVSGSVSVVVANANLVKKTLFPSEILPIVKILSGFVAHIIFLAILFVLMLFQHVSFTVYFFQAAYYCLCLAVLALGVSWAVAALNVFVRDVAHLVAVIIQVGFWGTPIFWDISIMPQRIQMILKINPMFYIVQGYRESFIYHIPFWYHPYQTLYFWCFALSLFCFGAFVFFRLKPQFADVL